MVKCTQTSIYYYFLRLKSFQVASASWPSFIHIPNVFTPGFNCIQIIENHFNPNLPEHYHLSSRKALATFQHCQTLCPSRGIRSSNSSWYSISLEAIASHSAKPDPVLYPLDLSLHKHGPPGLLVPIQESSPWWPFWLHSLVW